MFRWLQKRWAKRIEKDLPDAKVVEIVDPPGELVLARRQWGLSAAGEPFEALDVIFVPKDGKAIELVRGIEDDIYPPPVETDE